MKGHEIITEAIRPLMPDTELVREYCVKRGCAQKKPISIRKIVLITAVLSFAATLTVLAVNPSLLKIGSTVWSEADDEIPYNRIESTAEVYTISEAFREFINAQDWIRLDEDNPESYSIIEEFPRFPTLEDAAEFFDVMLPYNSILAGMQTSGDVTSNIVYHTEKDDARVILFPSYVTQPEETIEEDKGTHMYAENRLSLFIYFFTNDMGRESLTLNYGMGSEPLEVINYSSPVNGIEAVIYERDGFSQSMTALFSINNLVYQMNYSKDNRDTMDLYEFFTSIIDAFE